MFETFLKWVIFRAVLGLLPLAFSAFRMWAEHRSVTLEALFSRGELLLVACALSAGGIGELMASSAKQPILRLLLGGGSVVCLMFGALTYSHVSAQFSSSVPYDQSFVAVVSCFVYAFSLAFAAGCVILAEIGKKKL